MIKIIQKRIPKKTDEVKQRKAYKAWSSAITKMHGAIHDIPIYSADEIKSAAGEQLKCCTNFSRGVK